MPSESALRWAASAIGTGAKVLSVESLHGGDAPWLLRIEHEGSTSGTVLRLAGRIFPFQIRTGAVALRVAERHGVSAPRLIASDLDGRGAGVPATLESAIPGTSASPNRASTERLRAIGAAIAKVHKIALDPEPDLPLKIRSLQAPRVQDDEHALVRRWAALYRSSSESERPAVIGALSELTGLPAVRARGVITATHSTPLLQLADDLLREVPRPKGRLVFLHADLWAGNMMWDGDTNVVLIDWKDSGVGDPGVDLGHLRMTMAVKYGLDAATHVLDGWQRESGREATNLAYWDAVAALHTPADLDNWEPVFDGQGTRLSSSAVTDRRDAFLRAALDQLDRGGVTYEWLG